jgi:hypothetical protein
VEEKPDGLERGPGVTHLQNGEKMKQPKSELYQDIPQTDADIHQESEHMFKVKFKRTFSSEQSSITGPKSSEIEDGIVSPDHIMHTLAQN